jgi:hypothetical protein
MATLKLRVSGGGERGLTDAAVLHELGARLEDGALISALLDTN